MGWTYFNAFQVGLAAVALGLIVRRLRVLLFEAPLDIRSFLGALQTAIDAREFALARSLAAACAPAWAARLAAVGLSDSTTKDGATIAFEEVHAELEQALSKDRDSILALGRMASPLAFIGVIVEAGTALGGGEGLIGLQRGLAASIALRHALLMFSLGVATTLVCVTAVSIIQRQAASLRRDLERVSTAISRSRPS